MAQQPAQTDFFGLAPSSTAFNGRAIRAVNVDLSGGGLKPFKAPSFETVGAVGDIVYHNGEWVSGGESYISTDIDGIPALIYKSAEGKWKINMSNLSSADLWISAPLGIIAESSMLGTPPASVAEELGSGMIPSGEYEYFTRLIQTNAAGETIRESAFSTDFNITVTTGRVVLTRPVVSNWADRTKWQIFRRNVGGTYASLVGEASMAQGTIYDSSHNNMLGETVYPEPTTATDIEYVYVVVWVRNFGGWEHESTPSELVQVKQKTAGVTLTLEQEPPESVSAWRIYRISVGADPTTTFQLVAEVLAGTTEYTDTKANVELGAALGSSYRADNGALVTAGIPSDQFTGMAGPFNGFFVGWIGRDLYLSNPGNPAWWPGAFVVEANFPIVGVTQVGGNIAVVTEGGVQFGYGVEPSAFTLSQAIFGPGGISKKTIDKDIYLSYCGIYAVTGTGVELLTKGFDKDYFDALTPVALVYEVDMVIYFHTTGALVFDINDRKWTELSEQEHKFGSVFASGGEIYGQRANGVIVKLFGSGALLTMDYISAMDFSETYTKRIEAVRLRGTGTARLELMSAEDEDTIVSYGDLDLDDSLWVNKTVYAPVWVDTEALKYRIAGKPTVRAIMFELDKGSSES